MKLVKKIDIHVHTMRVPGPPRLNGTNFAMPNELRKIYDWLGVEKAVLLPLLTPDNQCGTIDNEDTMEVAQANPDLFYWFCCIDPRMLNNNGESDFTYLINYYKERGAKGVGEVTANIPFDDPRAYALFRACEKCNMPLTFHIGTFDGQYGFIDEIGLPRLEKVLRDFPNVRFLGHSQRFWSELGGDVTEEVRGVLPTGKVVPGGRVVELMRKYPNLCGDLSAGSGCNAMLRDPEFAYSFMEEFQDRLYYGTDICAPEDVHAICVKMAPFLDEAVQAGRISYEAYFKISRGNALKLLER